MNSKELKVVELESRFETTVAAENPSGVTVNAPSSPNPIDNIN